MKSFLRGEVISRGKVDVSISCDYHGGAKAALTLDDGYLEAYLPALYQLRDRYGLSFDRSVSGVLHPDAGVDAGPVLFELRHLLS